QAEDGIRDFHVTGVQTCALPISGHKFPTGFPSRRAWLHVTLTDAAGEVVFESGAWTEEGKVVGDDHDADPARYEPHHALIRSARSEERRVGERGDGAEATDRGSG